MDPAVALLSQQARTLSEERFAEWLGAPALLVPRILDEDLLDVLPAEEPTRPPSLDYGEGFSVHLIRTFDGAPERISIGRSRKCDVVVRHPGVSRLHAHFVALDGRRWGVRDADSSYGTFVEGHRIPVGETAWIRPGDRICFGRVGALFLDAVALQAHLRAMPRYVS